jgi:hypothetical protein
MFFAEGMRPINNDDRKWRWCSLFVSTACVGDVITTLTSRHHTADGLGSTSLVQYALIELQIHPTWVPVTFQVKYDDLVVISPPKT